MLKKKVTVALQKNLQIILVLLLFFKTLKYLPLHTCLCLIWKQFKGKGSWFVFTIAGRSPLPSSLPGPLPAPLPIYLSVNRLPPSL